MRLGRASGWARACVRWLIGGLLRESLLTCALTADALTADMLWSNRARRSTATIAADAQVQQLSLPLRCGSEPARTVAAALAVCCAVL